MSLNSILTTSLSGLFTNQEALRVTSANIANVNTENYNRIQVNSEATVLQGEIVGVQLSEVSRVVDRFLETSLRTAVSNTEEYAVQSRFHDRVQGFLGTPDSDSALSARIESALARFGELTLAPNDTLRRSAALSDLNDVLTQMSTLHDQFQALRGDASEQMVQSKEQINEALTRIFELNPLLVRETTLRNDVGGLESQLAEALDQLASEIDIQVQRQSNGAISVLTRSGLPLVDLTSLSQVNYAAPGVVTAETVFPPITVTRVNPVTLEPTSTPTDLLQHIRSGELRGLLDIRDRSMVDLSLSLGELSARIADEFNRIHNEHAAVPPANSLTGRETIVAGTNAVNFTGAATFAVVDANSSVVSEVAVDFDAQTIGGVANAGAFTSFDNLLTAINTGLGGNATLSLANGVMSFSATNANNGVLVAQDATNPSDRAGRGFAHFFGLNDLIESDSQGIFEPGVSATDTHGLATGNFITLSVRDSIQRELSEVTISINAANTTYQDVVDELNDTTTGLGNFFTFAFDAATGGITSSVNPPREGLTFQVVTDSTTLNGSSISLTNAFGLDDGARASAARNAAVKQEFLDSPASLAIAAYDQTAGVGNQALFAGDQTGALAFQRLTTDLVGFEAAGELVEADVSISQYTARFLGNAGLMAERATNLQEDNEALRFEIAQRQSDFSGVNLDEELSNLVIYQNAYSAAARILSSVQELYDTLLSAV